MTLGINPVDVMAMQAREYESFEILKIKLNALQPMETIRNAVPTKRLVIDANEAWTLEELKVYAPKLQELGVELIEQPLKRAEDAELLNYDCPVPLAADESCFDRTALRICL
jgi:L-alanine-DL-glutamate epimerase-like enolase superfamily enzyme